MSAPLVVDARGLACPAPVILLATAARDALGTGRASGGVVEITVWWTDPAAEYDIPAWARMRGHEVLGTELLRDADHGRDDVRDNGPDDVVAYATRVSITCP